MFIVFSAIMLLLSLLVFFAGIGGVIYPAFLRLRKRRHAFAIAGFAFVVMGFGMDLNPPPEAAGQGPFGLVMLAIWGFFVALVWGLMRFWRMLRGPWARELANARMMHRPEVAAKNAVTPEVLTSMEIDRAFMRRMSAAAQKATMDKENSRYGTVIFHETPAIATNSPKRRQRRTNTADLPAPTLKQARAGKTVNAPAVFERPELGKVLRYAPPGYPLAFEYVDEYGEVTDRFVVDWIEYPRHVIGICQSRGEQRTFRKDRVQIWYAGRDVLMRP